MMDPVSTRKSAPESAPLSSLSFDELCARQRDAIRELGELKIKLFGEWASDPERHAIQTVAEVRGGGRAFPVLESLFWPAPKEARIPGDGSSFVERVSNELGADPARAVREALADNPTIAPSVLDRIAATAGDFAFTETVSALLGMEPGIPFYDRPFRLKPATGPDIVASTAAQYGGIEIAEKEPTPAGKLVLEISGGDWKRYFAFESYDLGRQAIMAMLMNGQGEMIIGNVRD